MNTNLYRRRKDAGLCVACGGTPEPGKIRCAKCLEKSAAWNKKYLARKKEKITKANVNLQETIKAAADAGMSYGQYVAQNSEAMKWRIGLNDNKR